MNEMSCWMVMWCMTHGLYNNRRCDAITLWILSCKRFDGKLGPLCVRWVGSTLPPMLRVCGTGGQSMLLPQSVFHENEELRKNSDHQIDFRLEFLSITTPISFWFSLSKNDSSFRITNGQTVIGVAEWWIV